MGRGGFLFSRESIQQFVVRVLRLTHATGDTPQLPIPFFLSEPESWQIAFSEAERLGCLGIFAIRIQRMEWAYRIPLNERVLIERTVTRQRMRLGLLDEELRLALEVLVGDQKIDVLLLKGAHLSREIYPERLLRPMTDLDLLVRKDAFFEAFQSLLKVGYHPSGKLCTERQQIVLSRGANFPCVELHTQLQMGRQDQRTERIWRNSELWKPKDLSWEVRRLSVEDQLFYLIQHGASQHLMETPIWLNDIHLLIQENPQLDWNKVAENVFQEKGVAATWFVMGFLQSDWKTPIPKRFLEDLKKNVGLLRRRTLIQLAHSEDWFLSERSRSWVFRKRYLLRDNAAEVLRYGFRRVIRRRKEQAA